MENTVNMMIEKINEEIAIAKMYFDVHNENDWAAIHKIHGMIEMLQIVTDKMWSFDDKGVFEKYGY